MHANGANVPTAPSSSASPRSSNVYPPANIYAVTPTPFKAPTGPTTSTPESQPLLPPSSIATGAQSSNQHDISKTGHKPHPPIEALGFSIPPDYEPTANDAPTNIGWK